MPSGNAVAKIITFVPETNTTYHISQGTNMFVRWQNTENLTQIVLEYIPMRGKSEHITLKLKQTKQKVGRHQISLPGNTTTRKSGLSVKGLYSSTGLLVSLDIKLPIIELDENFAIVLKKDDSMEIISRMNIKGYG